MTDTLPYRAEYAKSGRSSCKGCDEKIQQGSLRIAEIVQAAFFDGKVMNWHHENCFFEKIHPRSINEIANFNTIKNNDLNRLKSKIALPPIPKAKAKKRCASDDETSTLKEFYVQYSKSNKVTCRFCLLEICKDDIRICKSVYDTEVAIKVGAEPLWHHVDCFVKQRNSLLYFAGAEKLPGFPKLRESDQKTLKNKIKAIKPDELTLKKSKKEAEVNSEIEVVDQQKEFEKQNETFHRTRNALATLRKYELDELMKINSVEVQLSKQELLDYLADAMTFGLPEQCPECKKGHLTLDTFAYKCTGNISEWTKCLFTTQSPKRTLIKIPEVDENKPRITKVFGNYTPKIGARLFLSAQPSDVNQNADSNPSVSVKNVNIPTGILPLKNLEFYFCNFLEDPKHTECEIVKQGGRVIRTLTETLTAVVSQREFIEDMEDEMRKVKKLKIKVVEEDFIDSIDRKGTIEDSLQTIHKMNMAPWVKKKSIPMPTKSTSSYERPTTIKLRVDQDVHQESGLSDKALVYVDNDGTRYTVLLTQTDVNAQKNSYHKFQVLEEYNKSQYWMFQAWGQIGGAIGGKRLKPFKTPDDAIEEFKKKYLEKSGNQWESRHNFVKKPNCYNHVVEDHHEVESAKLQVDSNCKLVKPVQELMKTIFDIDAMKNAMKEFELDMNKTPLGKLSKRQIQSGREVLSELIKLVEKGTCKHGEVVDATNRFYTIIPHVFEENKFPILDNVEIIQSKNNMLDDLLDIEIAYNLMKSRSDNSISRIEHCYEKLRTEITLLGTTTKEYVMISKYLKNSQGETHKSQFSIEISQIFKVIRHGEKDRYKPFSKLHNRRLLWHGSRITNFAGILSEGLRLPSADTTLNGAMFGAGIYFADMVTKSAQYSGTMQRKPNGIMLLCEVALGDMNKCHESNSQLKKAPKGTHSTWGVGRTQPDPAHVTRLPSGVLVPLGLPVPNPDAKGRLLYNEFIVYDIAQVNVKYLLELKYNYK